MPSGVLYHGGQEVESARSDWQVCAASQRRPDLRQEAGGLAGQDRSTAVRRPWLARATFFGDVSRRRLVLRLFTGRGTHLLAGKLRPGSIRGLLVGMTRRRRRTLVCLLYIGILRQCGRRQRNEGSHRTNEDRFCDPHMRLSFWNGNTLARRFWRFFAVRFSLRRIV